MISLQTWLEEARRAEALLKQRHASRRGRAKKSSQTSHEKLSDLDNKACLKQLGFGLRAAQQRIAVARLLREPHAFSPKELGDIKPSKLRTLAKRGLPGSRHQALSEIKRVAACTSSQLEDHGRGAGSAPLRRTMAACLSGEGRGFRLTVAAQRRRGQLVLLEPAPFPTIREACVFLAGASWPVGTVVVAAEGLTIQSTIQLEAIISAAGRAIRVVATARGKLPLSPSKQAAALTVLQGRKRVRQRAPKRHELAAAAFASMGWGTRTAISPAASRAAILLAIAERAPRCLRD